MFRFTIRDLLWLMVVVGMGVGWWVESRACRRYRTHMNYAVTEANYTNKPIVELLRELDASRPTGMLPES